MMGGGDRQEVQQWLCNFATAHAKREVPRAEAAVDAEPPGDRFRIRIVADGGRAGPAGEARLVLDYAEAAAGRGSLTWCDELAARVRALAREAAAAAAGARKSA